MRPVFLVLLAAIASCRTTSTEEVICAPGPKEMSALSLVLEDSITGARSPFRDVEAVVTDGDFRQSIRIDTIAASSFAALQGILAAPERPGVYAVTVVAAGYDLWTKSGIVGQESPDGCGMATQTVRVRLRSSR
jgi:hypothetical protein